MGLDLSFTNEPDYLFVCVKGEWTPDDVSQGIEQIAEMAKAKGHTRILLDARNFSRPSTEVHRFLAGEQIANAFRGRFRVAAVYPAELSNKFLENTAVNRGAVMIVLPDMDQAIEWLVG